MVCYAGGGGPRHKRLESRVETGIGQDPASGGASAHFADASEHILSKEAFLPVEVAVLVVDVLSKLPPPVERFSVLLGDRRLLLERLGRLVAAIVKCKH